MANTKKTVQTEAVNTTKAQANLEGFANFEAFEKMSISYKSIEPGKYEMFLKSWEFVNAEVVARREDDRIVVVTDEDKYTKHTKPYVKLNLATDNGEQVEKRIYINGLQMFMDNVSAQTHGVTARKPLSEILAYLENHLINVWVSIDPQYGRQVDFFDRQAWLKRRAGLPTGA